MEPIHEEQAQSLTYQEFQDYLSENIITHNRSNITQQRQRLIQNQQPQESKWNKITKMVLTLSIIVVIVVVIAVLI
jgi:elongation factor P--beta-lysine ligase